MHNLVIDIGNTFSKIALFNNRSLLSLKIVKDITVDSIDSIFKDHHVDNSIISSVKSDVLSIEKFLKEKSNYIKFSTLVPSLILNKYRTPDTLGLDRYAGVIAAESIFPYENCLVIDAGTCITYDFKSNLKEYWGGSISPGLNMRFKAMHAFTSKLPDVQSDFNMGEDFGTDTQSSILTGVQKGIIYEVLGFINLYYLKWPGLKVLLCGGDVNFFDTQLKSSIFAHTLKTEPNLVLIGLNEVIHYNND